MKNNFGRLSTSSQFLAGVLIMISVGCSDDGIQTPNPPTPGSGHTVPFGANSIAAGSYYSLALQEDGTLWEWGQGHSSPWLVASGLEQIVKNGKPLSPDTLLLLRYLKENPGTAEAIAGYAYTNIAIGRQHTLVLATDGTLYSFGSNNFGQLGDGTYLDHSTSQFVEVGSGYAAVAAAEDYSFGLKKDNTLWAWGGDWENAQTIPVQIGEGFVKLVARGSSYSSSHLLAEKEDGGLWEWIFYENGGIGVLQPVGIGGGGYKMIAVGDFHSLALLEDGTLLGWGAGGGNDGYLVGSGPSASIIGTGFAAVVAGSGHSLAIKKDGTLWAWGYNYLGQLGDGTTIDRNNPVPVLY